MTYYDFLNDYRLPDNEEVRQAYELGFGGRGVHGRPSGGSIFYATPQLNPENPAAYEQEGRNFLTAVDRQLWNQPGQSPESLLAQNQESLLGDYISQANPPTINQPVPLNPFYVESTYKGPSEGLLGPTGAIGPQDSFAVSADPNLYGGSEAALAQAATDTAAADSATGLSGPQAFAANMALNMIPTRDRNKVNTPLGDEGSYSGITKGAGKGALTAATLSGGNPYATVAGGVLGAYGGAQGYFDSTTPPSIQIARIKRGGGMPQGLLGGGTMYG